AMNYAGIGSHMFIESIRGFVESWDLVGGLIKGSVFGAIIAVIGCHKGLNAQQGAEGVGKATTASVVLSIILIFIFNYFLSAMLYVHGG
ncbi:MlaE family ABC transporter permease, partial [Streptococcus salivarius]|uniref:MlaE family ABC transporter permease n=1 Tax=Streptococcus salivarius TaxID=1304 RepID=UPI001D074494